MTAGLLAKVFSGLTERRYSQPATARTSCALQVRVPKKILSLLLIFAVSFSFGGCAYVSASGRREMAYRHYVAKQTKQQRRAMARAQKAANRQLKLKMKSAVPSEPQFTTSVENAPGAWSEPVAPPVTVSASGATANQTDNEPSQP